MLDNELGMDAIKRLEQVRTRHSVVMLDNELVWM